MYIKEINFKNNNLLNRNVDSCYEYLAISQDDI